VDPRLRTCIDASVGWYEDLFALHGVGSVLTDGLWGGLAAAPPLHSDAVTVEPEVSAGQVAERLAGRIAGRSSIGVKDSFAHLDLTGHGFEVLFGATWIHRPPAEPPARLGSLPAEWTVVRTAAELAEWTGHHDTTGVLLPGLLERAHFAVLAKRTGGQISCGAVARLGSGAVDLSNVYAAEGHAVDWPGVVAAATATFPGRQLVGYERGADLDGALSAGFAGVGNLTVWVV
jgi:hypothetical protein